MAEVITLKALPNDWADPVLTRAQAESLLAQPNHILFAVKQGDALCGHLLASLMPHTQADILTLFVPPQYRRQGYALKLVQTVLGHARKAACSGLTLEVESTNTAAIKLYAACGLQQVAVRAGYYYNPVSNLKADALVLAVTLA